MTLSRRQFIYGSATFGLCSTELQALSALPSWYIHSGSSETGFQPSERLSLDGEWQIAFDPSDAGRAQKWETQSVFEALQAKRRVQIPCCWETIEQDYQGVAFYGHHFQIPASWAEKTVRVMFHAVNYRAEVWVNDHPAGVHDGGYTPFTLFIGDLLQPGKENFLSVRVIGPLITKDIVIDGIGRNETPHWRGAITGGIWQPVELIATTDVLITDIYVVPRLDSSQASLQVSVLNRGKAVVDAIIEYSILGGAASVSHSLQIRPGANIATADVRIESMRPWSPADPHLYTTNARITTGGTPIAEASQRFGMRECTVEKNRFLLNGKPVSLRAAFWEGLYPGTLAFAPSTEMIRHEITLAKDAGFNVLRPWRKPLPPPVLDIADEMGMMIIGAPPIECMGYWPQISAEMDQRVENEIRDLVMRDRNHPSLIVWELFNEVLRPEIGRLKQPMSALTRNLDSTRIIIDESGGWAGGAHAYLPDAFDSVPLDDLHVYFPAPVNKRICNFFETIGGPQADASMVAKSGVHTSETLVFVSEMGFGGLPDFPANVREYQKNGNPLTPDYRYHHSLLASIEKAAAAMQWQTVFPTTSDLCLASQRVQAEGNKRQVEAMRRNNNVAGYCLHAFTDGDWVLGAGLLDLFRHPKLTYESVKMAQQPLHFPMELDETNLATHETGHIAVSVIHDGELVSGMLRLEVIHPSGKTIQIVERKLDIAQGTHELFRIPVGPFSSSGLYTVRSTFRDSSGSITSNNVVSFYCVDSARLASDQHFAVFDPEKSITPYLTLRQIAFAEFSGKESGVPVVVACETVATEEDFRRYVELLNYVERGGIAVLLRPPLVRDGGGMSKMKRVFGLKRTAPANNSLIATGLFPHKLVAKAAMGNWVPVNHAVRKHPAFDGLPVNDFMGDVYQNVCAPETILNLSEPPIVGSISMGMPLTKADLDYRGLVDAWWGSDLTTVQHGKGTLILSTLRVPEGLSIDPVAITIFNNLVRWAGTLARPVPAPASSLQASLNKYVPAYQEFVKARAAQTKDRSGNEVVPD